MKQITSTASTQATLNVTRKLIAEKREQQAKILKVLRRVHDNEERKRLRAEIASLKASINSMSAFLVKKFSDEPDRLMAIAQDIRNRIGAKVQNQKQPKSSRRRQLLERQEHVDRLFDLDKEINDDYSLKSSPAAPSKGFSRPRSASMTMSNCSSLLN